MIRDIQDRIIKLKKENDICILAHSYQRREITEVADFTGDSYALSLYAAKAPNKTVIMCGVRFMAETAKILSPEKKVYLANPDAGCPMAEQMDKELICGLKEMYPGYAVAAYINTTAELKTVCDFCVTSSSAVKVIENCGCDDILFIPDCNLGAYVSAQLPGKNIKLVSGGCPTHARVNKAEVEAARKAHPSALLIVHPECVPEVTENADFVGSTSQIMDFAKKSSSREFIIGTENSITEHLQFDCPDKYFYPLSKDLVCHNMKITTLMDLLACAEGRGGEEIELDGTVMTEARRCIDKMIELGEK